MPRVLLATGGTGGHIFPAEALGRDLSQEGVEILFSGANLSSNRYFNKDLPYKEVRSGKGLRSFVGIIKGVWDSYRVIKQFNPDLIIGFGSYTTFPLMVAAIILRVPFAQFAADSVPGKVIRWFSPFAKFTAVQFPKAKSFLKGKVVISKMPLRQEFSKLTTAALEAKEYFNLSGDHPILLVFGGSQGAKFFNQSVPAAVAKIKKRIDIIHVAGSESEAVITKKLYENNGLKAIVKAYEPKMQLAWSLSTFACTRSGAVSLAEQLEFEVPGLLVPYPSATDQHQDINADYFVKTGFVEKRSEKELNSEEMSRVFDELLSSHQERRHLVSQLKNNRSPYTLKELVMEEL